MKKSGLAVSLFLSMTLLSPVASFASKRASSESDYYCVAKVACPDKNISLQELPSDRDAAVRSSNDTQARKKCRRSYNEAYRLLERRAPAGCLVQSEAFPNVHTRR